MGGGLPFQVAEAGADAPGRDDEHREQDHRQHGDQPRQPDHHDQRQAESDDVGDHAGQGGGERPLGADDVVVEPADQRAGVGAGEEGDRHLLDVLEHLRRRSRIRPSPRAGGLQPTQQADHGAGHGDSGDQQGQADHRRRGLVVDDGVDGLAGQDRDGHTEHGPDGGQGEEGDDRAPVGAGEGQDPPQGGRMEAGPAAVLLGRAPERRPHGHVHRPDGKGSTSLEVKGDGGDLRHVGRRARAVHRAVAVFDLEVQPEGRRPGPGR